MVESIRERSRETAVRAVLLDGSSPHDERAIELAVLVAGFLTRAGWSPDHLKLRELTIHPCVGCFGCWTRSPGECRQDDDGPTVARATAHADLLVYFTRVRFGGYGSLLKGAVDRLLCNAMPTIAKSAGETRHPARYGKYPRYLVLGLMDSHEPASAAIFEALARKNADNAAAPSVAVDILLSGWPDDAIVERLAEALVTAEAVA